MRVKIQADRISFLDKKKDYNRHYVSYFEYEKEMTEIVEPYLSKYEKTGYFRAKDGLQIFYRTYIKKNSKRCVAISHGFTESSEKYKEIIYYFLKENYSVFIMDHRGHGYSGREVNNPSKVYVRSMRYYVDDYIYFMSKIIKPVSGKRPVYFYAHSMGAGIALGVIEKKPNFFKKAVFSTPMLEPMTVIRSQIMKKNLKHLYIKGLDKDFFAITYKGWPKIKRYDLVSCGSPVRYDYYYSKCVRDMHYQTFSATNGWMRACLYGTEQLRRDERLAKIKTPILVFRIIADTRVKNDKINSFVKKVPTSRLVVVRDVMRHELYTAKNDILIPYMNTILEYFEE